MLLSLSRSLISLRQLLWLDHYSAFGVLAIRSSLGGNGCVRGVVVGGCMGIVVDVERVRTMSHTLAGITIIDN